MRLSKLSDQSQGFVLVTTLLLMVVFLVFLSAYSELSRIELVTTRSSKSSTEGFYTAEAGLNLRADAIRDIFNGYNNPSGSSPLTDTPCTSGDNGSGDYACQTYTLGSRRAVTYISEEAGNPVDIKIPSGERYSGLSAQEYRYTTTSQSLNSKEQTEAILELTFRSRLVPMFQFAAFYDKDLEILPGPPMTLSGPIHTNGDLYLNANNRLTIQGQVTVAGSLYRGRKDSNGCNSRPVAIYNPVAPVDLIPTCGGGRRRATTADVTPYNGEVEFGVDAVIVPEPEVLDPTPGEQYWNSADLRIVVNLGPGNVPITTSHSSGIEVRAQDNSVDTIRTALLHACTDASSTLTGSKAVDYTTSFFNNRENAFIRMLEIDMRTLLNCAFQTHDAGGDALLNDNRNIDDSTEGGLVLYFTVLGPNVQTPPIPTNYGVRIRNARELQSNLPLAPTVRGVTIVSNQAIYSMGHFNSPAAGDDLRIPAAFLGDSYNALSSAWSSDAPSTLALGHRLAADTNVNAAILSGTDSTGGREGSNGQGGNYNGGLENYPRFHENWSARTFRYRGSFVSLDNPRYTGGTWLYGGTHYTAPNRDWDYDTRFNTASNLPPLSPRFVYLRQELFVRDFNN